MQNELQSLIKCIVADAADHNQVAPLTALPERLTVQSDMLLALVRLAGFADLDDVLQAIDENVAGGAGRH